MSRRSGLTDLGSRQWSKFYPGSQLNLSRACQTNDRGTGNQSNTQNNTESEWSATAEGLACHATRVCGRLRVTNCYKLLCERGRLVQRSKSGLVLCANKNQKGKVRFDVLKAITLLYDRGERKKTGGKKGIDFCMRWNNKIGCHDKIRFWSPLMHPLW